VSSRTFEQPLQVATEPSPELSEEILYPSVRVPAGLKAGVSLPHQVAALAFWPFLEQLLNLMVGLVDLMVAGRLLETEAVNAVGAAMYLIWLVGMLIAAAGVGATALIARASGAGQWRRTNALLGQSVFLAAIWGLAMGLLFYLFAPTVAILSGLQGQSEILCTRYLHVLAPAVPCNAVLIICAACLRGSGDTRTPFLVMIVVNLVNIAACVLLVAPWSPIGGHGIAGLALGTLLAWVTGAACLAGILARGCKKLLLQRRFLHPRLPVLMRIIRVGLPNLMESTGFWLGNYLVIIMVGHLPNQREMAIGAHFVAARVESLSYMPGFAMGIAAAALTGQYLGIGDIRNARRAAWLCWAFAAALMVTTGLLFICFPQIFVRVFTDKDVFLSASPPLLRITGCTQIGFATAIVFSSVLRGAGDTRTAMFLTYGSIFLVRLPLVYLLGKVYGLGLTGVWVGLCSEIMFRGAIFLASFLRGNWAHCKI
jgi:putative MATE family efflux protein